MGSFSYEKSRAAELVAKACRVLGKLEMAQGTTGHVSYRLDTGNTMLIKAKGVDESGLRYAQPSDIIEVDFDNQAVEGRDGLSPPLECAIHIEIYKAHPEVHSVIHCHPEHAVLLTICEKEILPFYGAARPGVELAIAGVPTYPRSHTITTEETGRALVSVMGTSKVALMRGHGITVYGSSVEDATVRSLAFDQLLTMTYKAYLLGDPKPISDEDIAERLARPPRTTKSAAE